MIRYSLVMCLLLFCFWSYGDVHAQENTGERETCYSFFDETKQEQLKRIFQGVNNLRVDSNIAPYTLNDELCVIANEHAQDLAVREDETLPFERRSDDTTLTNWLDNIGFSGYERGERAANIQVFVTALYTPENVAASLEANHPGNIAFARQRRHRELGIGYAYNAERGLHYYVFIYASRPNVLPITVTSIERLNIPIDRTANRRVNVWLNDEAARNTGELAIIGRIHAVKLSEELDADFSCPESRLDPGWSPFLDRTEYAIEGGIGPATIYAHLCDETGRRHIESYSVFLSNDGEPIADFEANEIEGPAPLTIRFNNQSRFGERYEWDFNGNGQPDSRDESPTHTFTVPGIYNVTLTVYSETGITDVKQLRISVTGEVVQSESEIAEPETRPTETPTPTMTPEPTPSPIPTELPALDVTINATPQRGVVPFDVMLNSNLAGQGFTHEWNIMESGQPESSDDSVSWTFDAVGIYIVNLTVRAPDGRAGSAQLAIVADEPGATRPPPPPTPTPFIPPAPPVGQIINETGITSGESPLNIVLQAETTGEVSEILWDIGGDGLTDAEGERLERSLSEVGKMTIFLTVIGPGGRDVSFITFEVIGETAPPPMPPVAAVQSNVSEGPVPLTVDFFSTSEGQIDQYLWDFDGDGLTDLITQTGQVQHIYTQPGTYDMRLLVSGPGGYDEARTSVVVHTPTRTTEEIPLPPSATEPPSPTVGLNLDMHRLEDWGIVIQNVGEVDISRSDLLSLTFSGFDLTWESGDFKLSQLRPRECVILTRLYNDFDSPTEVNPEAYLLRIGCIVVLDLRLANQFWNDSAGNPASFMLEFNGTPIAYCDAMDEFCSTVVESAVEPPPVAEIQPPHLSESTVAVGQVRLHWRGRILFLQNTGQNSIPAGSIVRLSLVSSGLRYPTEDIRWNSFYDFQRVHPDECITLLYRPAEENPDYADYSTIFRDLGCVGEVTSMTITEAVWLAPENMQVYIDDRLLQTCQGGSNGECYFDLISP